MTEPHENAQVVPFGRRQLSPAAGAVVGHTPSSVVPGDAASGAAAGGGETSSEHATAMGSPRAAKTPSIARLRRSIGERLEL